MRGNRFCRAERLAGLAITPLVLSLAFSTAAGSGRAGLYKGDTAFPKLQTDPTDLVPIPALRFGPVLQFGITMAAAAPVPARPGPAIAGSDEPASPEVWVGPNSAATPAEPAPPTGEITAPEPQSVPAPVERAPYVQSESPFASREPELAVQSALLPAAPLVVAADGAGEEGEMELAAAPDEANHPATIEQGGIVLAPQTVTSQPLATPSAPTVVIADWKYMLPSEARAASVQTFAGEAVPHAIAPPTGSSTTAPARTGRAALRSPARLAKAQSGVIAAGKGVRQVSAAAVPAQPHGKYRLVGSVIEFKLPVQVNGEALGNVTLHVQPDQKVSLQLKELVALFAPHLDPQLLQALSGTATAEEFVTFDKLRSAGIDIRYDAARDQILLNQAQP